MFNTPKNLFQDVKFNFVHDNLIDVDLNHETSIAYKSKLFEKPYKESENKMKRIATGILNCGIILTSVVLLVIPIFPLNLIGAGIAVTYIFSKLLKC